MVSLQTLSSSSSLASISCALSIASWDQNTADVSRQAAIRGVMAALAKDLMSSVISLKSVIKQFHCGVRACYLFSHFGLLQSVQESLPIVRRFLHYILHLLHSVDGVLDLFVQVLFSLAGDLCAEKEAVSTLVTVFTVTVFRQNVHVRMLHFFKFLSVVMWGNYFPCWHMKKRLPVHWIEIDVLNLMKNELNEQRLFVCMFVEKLTTQILFWRINDTIDWSHKKGYHSQRPLLLLHHHHH